MREQQTVPTVAHGVDGVRALAGAPLGTTAPVVIEQPRIDAFAGATDDHQWIHVDARRASDGPFGATIAHGYLTLSLCSRFLAELLDVRGVSMAINYGVDRVRFPSPVPVGSALQATGRVAEVSEVTGGVQSKVELTIGVPGAAKPACVAEVLVRHYA